MANQGVLPAVKAAIPPKVRSALGKARRSFRDALRAAQKRLARPNLYRRLLSRLGLRLFL